LIVSEHIEREKMMKAINLRTEHLENPLGLGIKDPRFYWNCEGGIKQSAYRLAVKRNGETIWDTGKVQSRRMTHIRYAGQPLNSRDRIEWTVMLWDENDAVEEAASSWFEMGLLDGLDWGAKWISGDYTPKKNTRYPADCFQKTFTLSGCIKTARLYITACGLYQARINGVPVGSFALAPGITDYRRRLQCQAYDVMELLQNQNALEITLADGWYRGSIGAFAPTNVFGRRTKLLCRLEIQYADGGSKCITSDATWRWSNDGPVRFADLKDGEVYDAAKQPSYSNLVREVKERIVPSASNNVEITEHETFTPRLITTPSGKKVLDFGQNIAGFIAFTAMGDKGQKIKLRLGEILDEDSEFTQANIQIKKPVKEYNKLTEVLTATGKFKGKLTPTPKQEVVFLCSGKTDYYKTAFAIFGFRYALIETDIVFDPALFKAIAVYSNMEQTGDFSCSNAAVNRFVENARWSMKGNFCDVPTDCPTRERLPWTGDAQIFFNTASYFMDTAAFFRKWLNDIKDGQYKDGLFSAIVPYSGFEMMYKITGMSAGWGDAAVLVPYRYWKRYGDETIVRDLYETMRRYALYIISRTGQKNKKAAKANPYNKYTLEKGVQLGEWLEPAEFQEHISASNMPLQTEAATAYLHYTMRCLAEIAAFLGKQKDFALFTEYADGAKKAYNRLFLKEGAPDTDRQAKLVRPLALGLTEGELKKQVEERLAQAVKNRNYQIGTGFLSTPFVLPVLTDAGFTETAYRMLENEGNPSWLAEVRAGATTVWETWDGKASHNHYSPGAVCEWLFNTAAGIKVAGENRFVIRPIPGGTLCFVRAEYRSIYGKVSSCWERGEDGGYTFIISIPPNTSAEIILPHGKMHTVNSGTYTYKLEVKDYE
jgi:alpha-L-rhamnosidase